MLDFSWSELAVIGTVALVCIGPKDLPKAMRMAGMVMRKARDVSREFQHGMEQMMHESELHEMQEKLKAATRFDLNDEAGKIIDPKGELAEALKPPDLDAQSGLDAQSKLDAQAAIDVESAFDALSVPDAKPEFDPKPEHSAPEHQAVPHQAVPHPIAETKPEIEAKPEAT